MSASSRPTLSVGILTDPGRRRPDNQDSVGHVLRPTGGIFVVADGMGGHRTGELASQMAVEEILLRLQELPVSPKALRESLEQANAQIYLAGQEDQSKGMGTTVTVLALDLPYALIAQVGDSRAYLLRQGELKQITHDHSWVAERVRQGLLTEEEARNHRWRNVITNALGSFPQVRVDLIGLKMVQDDVLLLCSDGLTVVLEDSLIEKTLKAKPEEAVQELVRLANAHGGPDNISAVAVRIERLPNKFPAKAYAKDIEAAQSPVFLHHNEDHSATSLGASKSKQFRNWAEAALLILFLGLLGYVFYAAKQ